MMSRTCTACRSKHRREIEDALAGLVPYRDIARQHGVSKDAVSRHREGHLPAELARALAVESKHAAADLIATVRRSLARLERLAERAEKADDKDGRDQLIKAALGVARLAEMVGTMRGDLAKDAPGVQVNVQAAVVQIAYVRDWRDGAEEAEVVEAKELPANGGGNGGGAA